MDKDKLPSNKACDACRRKKVRCEGGDLDHKCWNCVVQGINCTRNTVPRRKGPKPGAVSQVQQLRGRCEELEERLRQMQKTLDDAATNTRSISSASSSFPSPDPGASGIVASIQPGPSRSATSMEDESDSDEESHRVTGPLTESMKSLTLGSDRIPQEFHGESSISSVINFAANGNPISEENPPHLQPSSREGSWTCPERDDVQSPAYIFPDAPLLYTLVDLFFTQAHPWFNLLHRPTVYRCLSEGLHYHDRGFGGVVLLICATGALCSDDPAVLDDDEIPMHHAPESSWRSAGWKWARQVDPMRNALSQTPSVYDLQIIVLELAIIHAYPPPCDMWSLAGLGVRRAQAVGAHRRKAYGGKLTVEGELWKRAFWTLLAIDRSLCASLGRPCSIQEEDFDVDLPAECDDEYWTHPNLECCFVQPPGKPSMMSWEIAMLKLREILASASRTIYSTKKSRILSGLVGADWERRIMAELDSSLNHWQDSLPTHLKWDPNRFEAEDLFSVQAAALACSYHHVQIFIHRRFMAHVNGRTATPFSEASRVICVNSARMCGRVIDALRLRTRFRGFILSLLMVPAFESVVMLYFNIYRTSEPGSLLSEVHLRDLDLAAKCIALLEEHAKRFLSAGRLRDVLVRIASSCGLPPPFSAPSSGSRQDSASIAQPSTAMQDPAAQELLADDFSRWTDSLEAMQYTDLFGSSVVSDPMHSTFLPIPFDLNQADGAGYAQFGSFLPHS